MSNDRPTFRDQLIEVDRTHPKLDDQYRKELQTMLEKELSLPKKIWFTIVAMAALVTGLLCAFLAVTEPDLPTAARIVLAIGSLFAIAWLASMVAVLRRGKLNVKTDGRRIAMMVWTFTVLAMVFWLYLGMTAEDQLKGLQMILYGMTFLIAAAVYWLSHMIERTELSTRERFLELELRIAELAEKRD